MSLIPNIPTNLQSGGSHPSYSIDSSNFVNAIGSGWSSPSGQRTGIIKIDELITNGLQFTINSSNFQGVVGLEKKDNNATSYKTIDFAIHFHPSNGSPVMVIFNNGSNTQWVGGYSIEDKFQIRKNTENKIEYLRTSSENITTLLYTTTETVDNNEQFNAIFVKGNQNFKVGKFYNLEIEHYNQVTLPTNTTINWTSKEPNEQIIENNGIIAGVGKNLGSSVSLLSQRTTSTNIIGFQFKVYRGGVTTRDWQGVVGLKPSNAQHNSNYRDMWHKTAPIAAFMFFSSKNNTTKYQVNYGKSGGSDSNIDFSTTDIINIIYKIEVKRTTNIEGTPIDQFTYYKTTDSNDFGDPIYTEDTTNINDSYVLKLSNIDNASFTIKDSNWIIDPSYSPPITSQAGGGGDPYLITLDNKLYKMHNFQGYSRMLQGLYQNQLFTINVSTRMSTAEEAEQSKQYVLENIKKNRKIIFWNN